MINACCCINCCIDNDYWRIVIDVWTDAIVMESWARDTQENIQMIGVHETNAENKKP